MSYSRSVSPTQAFVLRRLVNATNTGLGSILPPPIRAGIQVPPVSNLRVISTEGNRVKLTWDEPVEVIQNVRQYNVFALDRNTKDLVLGPIATSRPPVTVLLPVIDNQTDIVWGVQVELAALGKSDEKLVTISGELKPTYVFNERVKRTSSDLLASSEHTVYLVNAASGAVTITLPSTQRSNYRFVIKKIDTSSNAVNIVPQTGELIDGAASHSLTTANQVARLVSEGYGFWWLI